MSFSKKQQGVFRPLVEEAWLKVCANEGLDPKLRCRGSKRCGECPNCQWYRQELLDCSGATTTKDLDVKRDFEDVMYHFAVIAENIYWMTRRDKGDVRRLLHNVRQIAKDRDFEDSYIEGVAVKALKLRTFPGWTELTYKQVATVLSALKSKARHYRDCKEPAVDPDWSVG